VTTTTLRRVVRGLNLGPLLGLKIEAVEVVESDSLIVDSTMTTEQVNLPIQEGGSSVGTRGRGPIRGVLVLGGTGSFAFSALPGESIDC
jgi:hypothetical protein